MSVHDCPPSSEYSRRVDAMLRPTPASAAAVQEIETGLVVNVSPPFGATMLASGWSAPINHWIVLSSSSVRSASLGEAALTFSHSKNIEAVRVGVPPQTPFPPVPLATPFSHRTATSSEEVSLLKRKWAAVPVP